MIKDETWRKMVDHTILSTDRKFICDCRHPVLSKYEIERNINTIKEVPTMINALIEAQEIIEKHTGGKSFAIESVLKKIELKPSSGQ